MSVTEAMLAVCPRARMQHTPRMAQSGSRTRQAQAGMSLIEMMIALLLGLIVVAAVYNMYTGTMRSSRFTNGLQSMQENGRTGVSVLQKGFRLAGYSPATRVTGFELDPAQVDVNTVVVRLNQAFDCNGQSTAASGGVAVNTYSHDADAEQIRCRGNSALASDMPIVDGVEQFRVLYGIDMDADDVPESYVPFGHVDLTAERIAALRFALLVSSGTAIRSRPLAEQHVVLDAAYDTNDRVVRSVFSSTVKLRNRR